MITRSRKRKTGEEARATQAGGQTQTTDGQAKPSQAGRKTRKTDKKVKTSQVTSTVGMQAQTSLSETQTRTNTQSVGSSRELGYLELENEAFQKAREEVQNKLKEAEQREMQAQNKIKEAEQRDLQAQNKIKEAEQRDIQAQTKIKEAEQRDIQAQKEIEKLKKENEALQKEKQAAVKEETKSETEPRDSFGGMKLFDSGNRNYLCFREFAKKCYLEKDFSKLDPNRIRRSFSLTRYGIISSNLILEQWQQFNSKFTRNFELVCYTFNLSQTIDDVFGLPYVKEYLKHAKELSILGAGLQKMAASGSDDWTWDLALLSCLRFKFNTATLPEEQYRSHLWAPILESFLAVVHNEIQIFPECRIRSIIVNYQANQSVDIAAAIIHKSKIQVPILFCEVAAAPSGDDDHKDFQKLAGEMHAALYYYVSRYDRMYAKDFVIFGLYLSGLEYQFCTMTPIFRENEKLFIAHFQTSRHWKYVLGKSTQPCALNCRNCVASIKFEKETTESDVEGYFKWGDNEDLDDPQVEEVETLEGTGIRRDLHDCQAADVISSLKPLKIFCDAVIEKGIAMKKLTAYELEHGPVQYPPGSQVPQESRGSSSTVTPGPGRPKVKSTSNIKTRSAIEEINGRTVSIITKKYSKAEIENLQLVQCRNVVTLLYAEQVLDLMVLVEEELLSFSSQVFPNDRQPCLLTFVACFMLDCLSALIVLQSKRIVHRDISTNNIMFCTRTEAWKLIDFDASIVLPESGKITNNRVYGTRPYIAPEILNGEDYDQDVDIYSLGAIYRDRFGEPLVYCAEDCHADRFAAQMDNFAKVMVNKTPGTRQTVQRLYDVFLKCLHRINNYYLAEEKSIDIREYAFCQYYLSDAEASQEIFANSLKRYFNPERMNDRVKEYIDDARRLQEIDYEKENVAEGNFGNQ